MVLDGFWFWVVHVLVTTGVRDNDKVFNKNASFGVVLVLAPCIKTNLQRAMEKYTFPVGCGPGKSNEVSFGINLPSHKHSWACHDKADATDNHVKITHMVKVTILSEIAATCSSRSSNIGGNYLHRGKVTLTICECKNGASVLFDTPLF